MELEDRLSKYANIAPVNKAFNMICAYFIHGKGNKILLKHSRAYERYLNVNNMGFMSCNGTDGTQVWDCALFGLAFHGSGKNLFYCSKNHTKWGGGFFGKRLR